MNMWLENLSDRCIWEHIHEKMCVCVERKPKILFIHSFQSNNMLHRSLCNVNLFHEYTELAF
jgi:hypothetical protein